MLRNTATKRRRHSAVTAQSGPRGAGEAAAFRKLPIELPDAPPTGALNCAPKTSINAARLIGFNRKTTAAHGWQPGPPRAQSHRALPGRILAQPVGTSERNANDEVYRVRIIERTPGRSTVSSALAPTCVP